MTQQNQRSKKILGLVGAICGSLLFGLPEIAQADPKAPYNGNGQLSPNNDVQSPDRNNPGTNQSPDNRLTPSNPNPRNNPGSRNNRGINQSPDNRLSPSDSNSGAQQQYQNNNGRSPYNSNSNSLNSSNRSAVLNPCPSIFSEPKYRDTVGLPAGCPATPGTLSAPQQ